MTEQEADLIIAKLTAVWPQRTMSPPQAGEWHDVLHHFDYPVAVEAVEALRTVHDWLPTHRQFCDAAAAIIRRARMETPALPAPADVTYRERGLSHVRQLRAQLRAGPQ